MARSDPKPKVSTLGLNIAMKITGRVVERRATIPVLSCVRLAAGGVIEASDLDNFVSVSIDDRDLRLTKEGVSVPQHVLAAALKDTDGSVAVTGEASKRFLKVGSDLSVRIAVNPDDLPKPNDFEVAAKFTLPARELADDIAAVSPAMSEEETRYYLMGMFWHIAGSRLCLAATDGHRLHRVSRPIPDGVTALPASIVPRKAIALLSMAIGAQPGVERVEVEIGGLRARFKVGAVTITSRLIDGTFPDYSRVIPEKAKGGIRLQPREIIRPAQLAAKLMGRNRTSMVLRPKDGTISTKDPQGIEIEARLDREIIGKAVEEIGFRHEYLVDALTPFGTRNVTMAFEDSASPSRIDVDGDDRLLVILMPMRV